MQKAYVSTLYELALSDARVCSVLSDSGTEYDELFAREFPDRCINVGIAEANQVAVAAGMAKAGKVPFVYTSGAFLAYRAYEFIRDDVCLQRRNVKIVGMGSGLSWSTLGPTHHTTEDIAALRALPGLCVLSPSTPLQAAWCVRTAYGIEGPVYVRLGMGGEQEYYDVETAGFEFGRPCIVRDGSDATVFCTGAILGPVMEAAEILGAEGVSIRVADVHTLKPVDGSVLLGAVVPDTLVFTIEEHNVAGGLGGIVAEAMACTGCASGLVCIGLDDCFARAYGTYDEVRRANGLDTASIAARIREGL